ncbi:MAG: DUF547 domain-containing protein [Bacteroidia bacterium]|nr:DUF547 domain-containing protein [Bacteroidia bacterium]
MKLKIFLTLWSGIILSTQLSAQFSHDIWNSLLKKHVSSAGIVDYKGFIKDSMDLNKYLKLLSDNPPDAFKNSKNDQMAYWINAYNSFTIKLIIRYYPVKSIKDIAGKIPFVNTPWDIKFIKIGNETYDLNNIEHGKLRKKFNDPRVHMALVCASKSCPILLNEAFTGAKLDAQFEKQAKSFLADPFRNKISPDKPQISLIFKWYAMDFKKNGGSVVSFINKYSSLKINQNATIDHLNYDWSLNE